MTTELSTSLMPRAQSEAWRTLVTMSDALPQGLILVGPSGVGKRRSAKALFQLLNCADRGESEEQSSSLFGAPAATEPRSPSDAPCGRCVSCRKIAEGRHTDLIEIAPRGDAIAVDELRAMKISLHYPPMESRFRFVILDDAHRLSIASANNLLKTLEEPPAHTRFFLITHERGLLLPTITSRCQFVRFSPLDEKTLTALLAEHGHAIPDRFLKTALALLAGGMDRAPLITDEKTLAFIELVERSLAARAMPARPGADLWLTAVQLAEQLAAQGDSGDWKTELLLDLIIIDARGTATSSRSHDEARRVTRRALEAAHLRRRLDRHANKKLIALAAAELATASAEAPA